MLYSTQPLPLLRCHRPCGCSTQRLGPILFPCPWHSNPNSTACHSLHLLYYPDTSLSGCWQCLLISTLGRCQQHSLPLGLLAHPFYLSILVSLCLRVFLNCSAWRCSGWLVGTEWLSHHAICSMPFKWRLLRCLSIGRLWVELEKIPQDIWGLNLIHTLHPSAC